MFCSVINLWLHFICIFGRNSSPRRQTVLCFYLVPTTRNDPTTSYLVSMSHFVFWFRDQFPSLSGENVISWIGLKASILLRKCRGVKMSARGQSWCSCCPQWHDKTAIWNDFCFCFLVAVFALFAGRLYDFHVLDMIELGIEKYVSLSEIKVSDNTCYCLLHHSWTHPFLHFS